MSKTLVTKTVCGERLTLKLLGAAKGLKIVMLLKEYPVDAYLDEVTGEIEFPYEGMTNLVLTMSPEHLATLHEALFEDATVNGEPLDPEIDFAANYGFMIAAMREAFILNFSVFYSFLVKPFEKPEFKYDSNIEGIFSTSATNYSIEKMAKVDDVTQILHSVYFSTLHHETWDGLVNMPLGDFWLLKVGIESREAAKQEVDNNQFRANKPRKLG
ncbi:hypothetical protein [Escherichia coli]|uniref:hypothetical protein n=1 Tax=Escherichia coli TaxID=562 RepID=UPI001CA5FEA9|nr:hypothetical protein [Escherichia coli]QZY67668.1 hypothetical protein K7X33_16370 [Escherichia coli]